MENHCEISGCPKKLQFICLRSILLDHEITCDAVYEKGTFARAAFFLKGRGGQWPRFPASLVMIHGLKIYLD